MNRNIHPLEGEGAFPHILLWLLVALVHVGIVLGLMKMRMETAPQKPEWKSLHMVVLPARESLPPQALALPNPEPSGFSSVLPVKQETLDAVKKPLSRVEAIRPSPVLSVPAAAPQDFQETSPENGTAGSDDLPLLGEPVFEADYLDNPAPEYPSISKKLGESGEVILRVFVDADGRAAQVEIRKTSGFSRLDKAAQFAVRSWRFIPASRFIDGKPRPVGAWVLIPITFKIS